MNVFYQFVVYAVPMILISNESLRCHEQLYIYIYIGSKVDDKKAQTNIFGDKKMTKVAEEFLGAFCSKISVTLNKLFQSNSFIYHRYIYIYNLIN